eukprot:2494392-Alexandrium_andersonii.AAC.1
MIHASRALDEIAGKAHERRPVGASRGRHSATALLGREPKVGPVHAEVVCPRSQRSKTRAGNGDQGLGRLFLCCLPA